jgi:uncharacterized protein DUF5924/DUF2914 family protein
VGCVEEFFFILMIIQDWSDILHKYWLRLVAKHPHIRWAKDWSLTIASLVSGAGTLFIFRRGTEYFPWFVGYLLLLWLAAVVFAHARVDLEARGSRVVGLLVNYTIQTLTHGLFLFLLPIYYASTTLTSRNVWFLVLLAAAALLTTVDPWYRAALLRFHWIERFLFGFGLFAALNAAFPLLRVQSSWALRLSGFVSVLALAPVFHRPKSPWRPTIFQVSSCAILTSILLWPARAWIPPVPLRLTRATFAKSVADLEPYQPLSEISSAQLQEWGGLACFTSVDAPAGLRESIYHIWRKDGATVARIALSPIRGGRLGGFRTYSQKNDLGKPPTTSWSVDVLTAHDQLVGRIRLSITP